MKRGLLNLLRDVIEGAPKGCSPYDRYAYNSLSWQAQHFSYQATTEEEKELCLFLRDLAVKKSNVMKNSEVQA